MIIKQNRANTQRRSQQHRQHHHYIFITNKTKPLYLEKSKNKHLQQKYFMNSSPSNKRYILFFLLKLDKIY